MDAETAMTIAVIALAACMCVATIYGVWLSFQPRGHRPVETITPPSAIGQEILPIRQAREIIDACWDNREVLE